MNRKRKQCEECGGDGRDRAAEQRYQVNSGASAWRHVPFLGHNCEDCNGTGWVPMDMGDLISEQRSKLISKAGWGE